MPRRIKAVLKVKGIHVLWFDFHSNQPLTLTLVYAKLNTINTAIWVQDTKIQDTVFRYVFVRKTISSKAERKSWHTAYKTRNSSIFLSCYRGEGGLLTRLLVWRTMDTHVMSRYLTLQPVSYSLSFFIHPKLHQFQSTLPLLHHWYWYQFCFLNNVNADGRLTLKVIRWTSAH